MLSHSGIAQSKGKGTGTPKGYALSPIPEQLRLDKEKKSSFAFSIGFFVAPACGFDVTLAQKAFGVAM